MAIRFLGSTSARPLGAVRLQFTLPQGRSGSSTSTACFIYFVLIIQAPTKPKGEPMIHFVAMGWFHLVFLFVLLNIHEICLKLKSGFRIFCKFPSLGIMEMMRRTNGTSRGCWGGKEVHTSGWRSNPIRNFGV
jgi:hypothetical protein